MMKRLSILLIFLLFLSFLLFAADGNTGGSEQSFVVSAYKKEQITTPNFQLSIYDALSSDLKTVSVGSDINISNYISKYLGTYSSTYSAIELGKRAVFSVHVDGNAPGNYTLLVEYGPLAPSTKDSSTQSVTIDESGTIIKATYLFSQYSVFFSESEAKTSKDGKQTIAFTDSYPSNTAVTISSKNKSGTTTAKWTVSEVKGDTTAVTGSYWQVHAMVALFIDNDSYENAGNGITYRAKVTVTLQNV